MRQKRRTTRATIVSILMGMLMSLGLVAVSSGTASATSDYDSVVILTDQLMLEQNSSHGSGRADISGTWQAIFSDCDNWTSSSSYGVGCTTANAAFDTALGHGFGWALVQQTAKVDFSIGYVSVYTGDKFATLMWNPETDANAVFRNGAYGNKELRLTGSSYSYGFNIVLDNDPSHPKPVVSNGQRTSSIAGSDYTIIASTSEFPYYSSQALFANVPIAYPGAPNEYEGVIVPTEPPPAKYVAMGDSYSSGEGNSPFEYGTDQDSDLCHRSTSAYPRQVQTALNLGATAFVACSGAVSDYIINEYNQENVELPQAAFVSDATRLITITIGGNDVGFGTVLKACTLPTDESGTTTEKHQIEHDACIQAIDDARTTASSSALQTKLETVFSGLRDLGHQDLQVVVAGYPNLLPEFGDITGTCVWGDGNPQTSGRTVASDETEKVRLLHDDLNATIEAAVAATEDDHIHFVDPSSTFAGHELCRPTPWFYNVVPNIADPVGQRGSYHPNASGETAYANAIEAEVNSFS